ncbi:uncharacterized protein LOC133785102 [Humulus lupulus]|uniref:uncharacterized protein LOC133785102 n=1 Tax=Humulus lupulus TaxID=3486 RepID=UPI002B4163CB|nr:uncharacterized protein LOC133785102 [Humulus lupulus]
MEIKSHLYFNGMDQTYVKWIWHGEEYDCNNNVPNERKQFDQVFDDPIEMVRDADEHFVEKREEFLKFLEDAEKPIFSGVPLSKLVVLVKLYNLKAGSGWSDTSFTKLLTLLKEILPKDNELPSSLYEAKKTLCTLGMEYSKIHACPNDCILYRNQYESETEFIRLFRNPEHAESLRWHEDGRIKDEKLRHPANSPAWKEVDELWPQIREDPRNLQLGLSADGINPFSNMSSSYSYWPVILCIYNLPPLLCMKRRFTMLTLLISGPKQPGNDIDIYLAPLIDDLKVLWNEIDFYDSFKKENFILRGVLLWTINDFPAYGNLSRCFVKGYKVDENVETKGKKKGKCKTNIKQKRNKKDQLAEDSKNTTCWKKKSIFFELEYWRHLLVRDNLDVMHIEKNICDSLIRTLLNIPGKTKDSIPARKDLVLMSESKKYLAPETGERRTYLPHVCYTLKKDEKHKLCQTLANVKVPDGYSSNIRNLVSLKDCRLINLKSHDCHVVDVSKEVKLCGSVCFRWMYPFERLMKVYKGYVRNRSRPEGCIVEAYIAEEAVEFCTEYITDAEAIGIPRKTMSEDVIGRGINNGRLTLIKKEDWDVAHRNVLENTIEVQAYIEEYLEYLHRENRSKSRKWIQDYNHRTFHQWFRDRIQSELSMEFHKVSENLRWISLGPTTMAIKHDGFFVNGYRFSTKARDDVRVTQNNGVCIVAKTLQFASARDKKPFYGDMKFYGVIEEIWELDYCDFRMAMFKCNWVEGKYVRSDELGCTLVDLNKLGHKEESFILASQAKQVLYIQDPLDSRWSIVLASQPKFIGDDDYEIGELQTFKKEIGDINEFEGIESIVGPYVRRDCNGIWIVSLIMDHHEEHPEEELKDNANEGINLEEAGNEDLTTKKKKSRQTKGIVRLAKIIVDKIKGIKINLRFNKRGQSIGTPKRALQYYLGMQAKSMVSITYDNWHDVPAATLENVWKDVNVRFID